MGLAVSFHAPEDSHQLVDLEPLAELDMRSLLAGARARSPARAPPSPTTAT